MKEEEDIMEGGGSEGRVSACRPVPGRPLSNPGVISRPVPARLPSHRTEPRSISPDEMESISPDEMESISPDEMELPVPRRLLLTFAGGLGDLIMALPLIARAVRQVEEVWLWAYKGYEEWLCLLDLPDLKVAVIDPSDSLVFSADMKSKGKVAEPFDAAIMLHSTPGDVPAGAGPRPPAVAFAGRHGPFLYHASDANLMAGAAVGLRETDVYEYPLNRFPKCPAPLLGGGYVVICPDLTTHPSFAKKLLPLRTWRRVVSRLQIDGYEVVGMDGTVPGVDLDVDYAFWGSLKRSEVVRVLEGAKGVITVDSGVAHLAAVLGRPTLAVWGPTSMTWSVPRGPRVATVSRPGWSCAECLGTELWERCQRPGCMGVRDEVIVDSLRRLWKREALIS